MIRGLYRTLLSLCRIRGLNRFERPLRALSRRRIDTIAGLKLDLDLSETAQIELFSGHIAEPQTLALIARLLAPGETAIDIGAHIGLHALTAGRAVGPMGTVIALDPQPYCCARILANAGLNGLTNVLVVCAAAGESDGLALLHEQGGADRSRLTLAGSGPQDTLGRFEAPVVRLDTLLARNKVGAVALLKIDVEGYEAQVLAGAGQALSKVRNVILECLPGADAGRLARLLTVEGFELRTVAGAPWQPGETLPENNVWASRSAQPLARPASRRRTGASK
jgi:FkbM family methyltransferase